MIRCILPALFYMVATAQPVAMVVDMTGKAAWDPITPVHITDEVESGRVMTLEKDARLVLIHLKTGTEQVFTGPARIRFKVDGSVEGAKATTTRRLQALQGSLHLKPIALAQAAVVMKEFSREAAVPEWPRLKPAGPCIQDSSPEFIWEELLRAKYRFEISDSENKTVFKSTANEPRLKLPTPSPLRGNGVYKWFLVAELPDGSTRDGSGTFRLLNDATRERLQAAKPQTGDPFAERLLYAALLDQLDIKDEARMLWKALAQERPEDQNLRRLSEK